MGSPVSSIVPICTWNVLKEKLSVLLMTPGHGSGLWMIHGSSNNKHINKNFWITLIM